ncbi:MAG: hypothetical protein ACE5I4_06140 [Thermoplasmata archaeon]
MKVLIVLLIVGSIALVTGGQLYSETPWDGPVTVLGTFGVGGSPEAAFDLQISFRAANPVNLLVVTWPAETPNTPFNPDMSVLILREAVTEEDVSMAIPGSVMWEATITNVFEGPNDVQLTVSKHRSQVNSALSFSGLLLAVSTGGVALVSWRRNGQATGELHEET